MLQHGDNETSISDDQASNDKTQQHTCNYRHTKRYCIRGPTLERSAEMTTGVGGIAGSGLNYFYMIPTSHLIPIQLNIMNICLVHILFYQ